MKVGNNFCLVESESVMKDMESEKGQRLRTEQEGFEKGKEREKRRVRWKEGGKK